MFLHACDFLLTILFFPPYSPGIMGKEKTDGLGSSSIGCISGCLAKSPFLSPSDTACPPPPNHLACPLLHPHSCCSTTCKLPSSCAEIANIFLFLMSICLMHMLFPLFGMPFLLVLQLSQESAPLRSFLIHSRKLSALVC